MSFGGRHLARPDLFPRRLSGEPWGGEDVALEIAGVPFVLEGLDAPRAETTRRKFGGWLVSDPPAGAVRTRVFRADDADFRPFPGAGEEMTTDVEPEEGAVRLCGPLWMARVEREACLRGALFLPPSEAPMGCGAIENYLRFVAGEALLRSGGVIVHSAAVVEGGRAHLFPAASGSGKSTLSRMSLAEGRTVLSDDLNALVRRDGRTFVAQVPFTGDLGRERVPGGPFPLATVYRLRKGACTEVTPLGRTQGLGLLFAQTPSFNVDPGSQDRLWDALGSLADACAFRTLTFARDEPLWSRIAASEGTRAVA